MIPLPLVARDEPAPRALDFSAQVSGSLRR